MSLDLKKSLAEFQWLKSQNIKRNYEYYLLRQAVKGNFRWPRNWPNHIPRITDNLCKPIVERFTTYLVGKGFSWNIDRPNSLEYRDAAERAEKVLRRLFDLSNADLQFNQGAKNGSTLGRTIFKVYKKGKPGSQHACFTTCQPDYFYGVPTGDDYLSDFSVVYYSYPMDRLEAERVFGPGDYRSEAELSKANFYDQLPERLRSDEDPKMAERRIPVLEIWTKDNYALIVGGVVKFNGDNPYKWSKTGEGFIPFVVIENIRNGGEAYGESDIAQTREINEHLNYLLSRKTHVVNRWLTPTVVWEGAPQNYAEILADSMGGGGAIPARLGSRLSFLAYDHPNPAVTELEQTLRNAALESAGMNMVALQGAVHGSINTGISVQAQYQPVLSTIEKKRLEWDNGLENLSAMLLEVQESIGDSDALGQVVVNQTVKSQDQPDGEVVALSGKDIKGLREVRITWPGVLPKDESQAMQLEIQKAQAGLQSVYTTLEKLGVEYPDDELGRIRMENNDPSLKGQAVAEQTRAAMPLLKGAQDHQQQMERMLLEQQLAAQQQQQQPPSQGQAPGDNGPPPAPPPPSIGDRLRELARNAKPQLDVNGNEPVLTGGSHAQGGSQGGY